MGERGGKARRTLSFSQIASVGFYVWFVGAYIRSTLFGHAARPASPGISCTSVIGCETKQSVLFRLRVTPGCKIKERRPLFSEISIDSVGKLYLSPIHPRGLRFAASLLPFRRCRVIAYASSAATPNVVQKHRNPERRFDHRMARKRFSLFFHQQKKKKKKKKN
jgi:hypothetical protein